MPDNVVYIGGKSAPPPNTDEADAKQAMRDVLLRTVRACRSGNVHAVITIVLENDGASAWQMGGDFSSAEMIAALEYTKFSLITQD